MMTTLALAFTMVATATQAQDPIAPPLPKQIEELNFMLGTWEGMGSGMAPDGSPIQVDGSATASKVMDRWIQFDTTDNVPGKGMMVGRFMLTYNPRMNQWEGVWFDNKSPFPTDFTGNFDGTSLILNSETVTDLNGTGSMQYTVTFSKKSETQMTMQIQNASAGRNSLMLDYTYNKR